MSDLCVNVNYYQNQSNNNAMRRNRPLHFKLSWYSSAPYLFIVFVIYLKIAILLTAISYHLLTPYVMCWVHWTRSSRG